MRPLTIPCLVLLAACGDPSPVSPPKPGPLDDEPRPPLLAPEREAFWARFVGPAPGVPGPETLAWCRQAGHLDSRVILGGDVRLVRDGGVCALIADRDAPIYRDELAAIARRWQQLARPSRCGGWIVKDHLVTAVSIGGTGPEDDFGIHWRPYREIERIIGTDRLLRDIDVEAVVRDPAAKLDDELHEPFYRSERGDGHVEAPGGPGGFRTVVFPADEPARLGVRIDTVDTRAVLDHIARIPPIRDIHYRVRADACSVTILLEPK